MRLGWKLFWLVVLIAAAVQVVAMRDPALLGLASITQPIAFNHKKHAGDLALPCTTCHQRAEKDSVAGRPPTVLCLGCHSGETNNPEIKKIRAYGDKGQEIPWRRVWRLPPHVFFPHRIHVVLAQIKCQTCHGPMETLTRPPARPLKTLRMNDCLACHAKWVAAKAKEANAGRPIKVAQRPLLTDCLTCHR